MRLKIVGWCGLVWGVAIFLRVGGNYSFTTDTLAERLRRRPAKPMGSPRVGSNPTGVVLHRTMKEISACWFEHVHGLHVHAKPMGSPCMASNPKGVVLH